MSFREEQAARLGINHTTVYRRIAALEDRLGKSLFERSGSGWVLTPVGERIVAFAESMAEEAQNIERQILADSHELSGLLRVTADEVDHAAREADVALRGTDETPPNLVGKRIAQIGFAVYGTKALKQQAALDPDAEDLPCITWVGDGHTRPPWIEKSFPNTQRIFRDFLVEELEQQKDLIEGRRRV